MAGWTVKDLVIGDILQNAGNPNKRDLLVVNVFEGYIVVDNGIDVFCCNDAKLDHQQYTKRIPKNK